MIVIFDIESQYFISRGLVIKGEWNFPHLPRVGEVINALLIITQKEFTYDKVNQILSKLGKEDFAMSYEITENKKDAFRNWIWEVINQVNIVQNICYVPQTEDYTAIVPVIYLREE